MPCKQEMTEICPRVVVVEMSRRDYFEVSVVGLTGGLIWGVRRREE